MMNTRPLLWRKRSLLLALFSCFNVSALGAETPIRFPDLFVLGVEVGGKATLQSVVEKFGATRIWTSGDASTGADELCYILVNNKFEAIMRVVSVGEAATHIGQINAIILLGPEENVPFRSRCARKEVSSQPFISDLGLAIGMSKAEVESALRHQATFKSGAFSMDFKRTIFLRKDDPILRRDDPEYADWAASLSCSKPNYEDFAHIEVVLLHGRASRIQVSRNQQPGC